ncbi:MAG: FAD-dependent monooxygenase, partial [Bacteroidota bacterium]
HQATVVIGAYGKRSRLDKQLDRAFIQQRAPYLGVKAHYAGDFPEDLVALHNFRGGYCGVSKVEDGRINICYLADYAAFKEHKNLADFEQQVVRQNPHLAAILDRVTPLFDQPLTISQVSFANKTLVEDGVLLAGDAAGMIHPLCGNGMGMAIGAAGLLVPLVTDFLQDRSTRQQLEQRYQQQWRSQFRRRLLAGRLFNVAFQRDYLLAWAIAGLVRFPSLLPAIIRQTHA